MKMNIAGKELNIKFGYKPTLKERIISRVLKMENIADEDGEISYEKIEDLMLFLPESVLFLHMHTVLPTHQVLLLMHTVTSFSYMLR